MEGRAAVRLQPNGTATINGDGTVQYTPDENFCGTDTFDYTVSDGQDLSGEALRQ